MRKFAKVPEGYSCPFCPSHKDDNFIWDKFLNTAICHGCYYELFYEVTTEKDPTRFYTDIIEDLTGKPYEEYQLKTLILHILEIIDSLKPENLVKYIKTRKFSADEAKEHTNDLAKSLAESRALRKDIKAKLQRRSFRFIKGGAYSGEKGQSN